MSDEIANILRTTDFGLINELKKDSSLAELANSFAFRKFVDALKPHIEDLKLPDENWQTNQNYLSLLNEVQIEINKHIASKDEDMIKENKALTVRTNASGAFLLIGGAIVSHFYTQQQENKRKSSSQNLGIWEKGQKVMTNIVLTSEETPPLSYIRYNLLLVVPANKLPIDLKIGQISNDKINDLIVNAVRAFCFETGTTNGNNVLNSVDCSDTPIDRTTENRVFVQVELSATSEIIKQQNKLGIRQAIKPSSTGQVLQFKNLQSARSASESTGFYKI